VLAHRRSLKKIFARELEIIDWRMVMALRLAALIYRSRADIVLPEITAKVNGRALRLGIARDWLAGNPLTATALLEEVEEWGAAGFELDIKSLRELEAGVDAQAA
jgi:exopolyphosphatase/guanosine-5'-triphosphate,3'-diphosphate pyrophosphatase